MKTDQEFIKGIYEKAQKMEQQDKVNESRWSIRDRIRLIKEKITGYKFRTVGSIAILAILAMIIIPSREQLSSNNNNIKRTEFDNKNERIRSIEVPMQVEEGIIRMIYSIHDEQYILLQSEENNGYCILKNSVKVRLQEGATIQYTCNKEMIQLSDEVKGKLKDVFGDSVDTFEIYSVDTIKIKE